MVNSEQPEAVVGFDPNHQDRYRGVTIILTGREERFFVGQKLKVNRKDREVTAIFLDKNFHLVYGLVRYAIALDNQVWKYINHNNANFECFLDSE